MQSILEIENEIIEEFELFGDDWESKYQHIIDLGKSLPIINEQYKTEENIIKGCQSRVWVHAQKSGENIDFTADSDAIITKGIIALLIRVLNNQTPKNIAEAQLNFIDKIGLKEHLSPTRANGLVSMIKQLKYYALALQN